MDLRAINETLESYMATPAIQISGNFDLCGITTVHHFYGDSITSENIQNYSNKILVCPLNEHFNSVNKYL